jgi:diguanylate cyclase (GGDEF)-like protein
MPAAMFGSAQWAAACISWITQTSGLMRRYQQGQTGLSDDRVMALLQSSDGALWVGTMEGGLNRRDPATERFQVFRNDPDHSDSLSANGIMSLFEDSRGILWIGTFGGGLNRYIKGQPGFAAYKHVARDASSISGDIVTSLAEDPSGALWVGTENEGLNRFDFRRGIFQHLRHDPADPATIADDTIYSLEVDKHGALWVGTRSGLSKLEKFDPAAGRATFRTYTSSDGLAGNVVYGIESDERGRLWLSGRQGLLLMDPAAPGFRLYTASEGLQGNEFNFGAHHRSPSGELFFGGPGGFNAFQPEGLQVNSIPPPVMMVGFYKFNRPAPELGPPYLLRSLNLTHRDALVTLEFAALDYGAPERNRFSYQLEGFENDWIDLGFERRITFTNLGSGDYTLRVRAANSDGVWNQHAFSIPLRVAPAPWRSPLAYAGYVLILAFAAILVLRRQHLKSTRAAEYQRRLEQDVQSRTEELRKKNEELGDLNTQLMELSLTDALTGLRNRRYLFEHAGKEVNYIQREHRNIEPDRHADGLQLILIMIDLDDFKPINDTHGHMVGDRILIHVRQVLQDACRASDVLVRWGGDEFLVIGRTPNSNLIQSIPERICSMIEEAYFDLGDGQVGRLTCSIGFTCYPGGLRDLEWPSLELLVTLSDRALYLAKKSGRNRWVGLIGMPSTDPAQLIPLLHEDPEKLVESGCLEVRKSDADRRRIPLQALQGKK